MKKLKLLLVIVIVTTLSIQAQSIAKFPSKKGAFHSYNSLQLLNGSTSTSVAIVSTNGLQFNRLFTGIGIGYDYYFLRTVPLFASVRYDVLGNKRKLQLFADYGINFLVDKKNEMQNNQTGRYWSTGFDYFIPVNKDAFTIGFGYSSKQVIYSKYGDVGLPVEGWQNYPVKYDYLLNRIALRLGWVF